MIAAQESLSFISLQSDNTYIVNMEGQQSLSFQKWSLQALRWD